jgi:hypothetical protein
MPRWLDKAASLTADDVRVLLEAASLLPLAAIAVRCLRIDRAARLAQGRFRMAVPPRCDPERAARLVAFAGRCLGTRCLTRSLALSAVLARRGVRSAVVIGAAAGEQLLRAHAWVEVDGRPVAERPQPPYRTLLRFESCGIHGQTGT